MPAAAVAAAAAEDAAILEQLKAKWGSSAAPAQQATLSPAQDSGNSLDNLRVCQECQGSGMRTEVYEHRRMESSCVHCEGAGVVFLGGRPVGAKHSNSSSRSKQRHDNKAEQLQRKIDQLQQAEARLQDASKAAASPEEQALVNDLLVQLQRHLGQLVKAAGGSV